MSVVRSSGHTEADCHCKLLCQQSNPAKSQGKSAAIHSQTSRPVSTPKLTDPLPFSAVYQVTTRIPPEIAVAHEAACQRQSATQMTQRPGPTRQLTLHLSTLQRRGLDVPSRSSEAAADPGPSHPAGHPDQADQTCQRRACQHRPPAVTLSPVSRAITCHPGQSVRLSDTGIDTGEP